MITGNAILLLIELVRLFCINQQRKIAMIDQDK